jgi:acyl-CoA synthetase (AMP-forming)/AMP-acid ligase II
VPRVGKLLIKGDSIAASSWNEHEENQKTLFGKWINTDGEYMKDKAEHALEGIRGDSVS